MRTQVRGWALVGVVVGSTLVALPTPATAATDQVSGVGHYDTTGAECGAAPAGYADFNDYPALVMTGDLEGCLYTNVLATKDLGAPSGVYLESGEELFVGSLGGGAEGTFTTTYKFESRWAPDVSTGVELHGRCEHPIVAGSGTDGFIGSTGRLDFKDDVTTGLYYYRGHISLR